MIAGLLSLLKQRGGKTPPEGARGWPGLGLDMDGGKTDEGAAARPFSGAAIGGLVAAGAAIVALLAWFALDRENPVAPDLADEAAAPPAALGAPEMAAPQATGSAAPASGQDGAPMPPAFDMFRATPDGAVTVAGQAAPGATVEVLLDGQPVASAVAGAGGAFALVFDAPPADAPRAMTLRTTDADGGTVESDQTLVMRPTGTARAETAGAESADAAEVALADPALAAQQNPPGAGQAPMPDTQAAAPGDATGAGGIAAPPPVLLADATGARLLDPGSTASPQDPMRIDTIAYDSGAEVTVSGRGGVPGGAVRAYIDNREVGSAAAEEDGQWRLVLRDVAPGTYTLRVDALDPGGKVARRAETPFLRETPQALLAAQAPAADAAPGAAGTRAEILTVQPGNTLWAIARETYGDGLLYVRVFEANRDQIRDPDLIYPGQVFALPE